jgi:hypothetical protein
MCCKSVLGVCMNNIRERSAKTNHNILIPVISIRKFFVWIIFFIAVFSDKQINTFSLEVFNWKFPPTFFNYVDNIKILNKRIFYLINRIQNVCLCFLARAASSKYFVHMHVDILQVKVAKG